MELQMFKKLCLTVLALTALMPFTPSFSQTEIQNKQPAKGAMDKDAVRVQAKLKDDFKKGLIDADQLSQMQRDFDGIMTREDDLRTRGNGMNASGKKDILKQLTAFEARLDKQAGLNKPAKKAK
jgi:hypothetical protein